METLEQATCEEELFEGVVDLGHFESSVVHKASYVCDPCDGCSQSCGGCSSQDYSK